MNEILGFVNEKAKVLIILKANHTIKELVEQGYVRMLHTKGRYMVTDKGNEVLKKMSLE